MYVFSCKIEVPFGYCLGGYGDSTADGTNAGGSLNVNGFGFDDLVTTRCIEVCSIDALYAGDLAMRHVDQRIQRIFAASHTHFAPMLDVTKPRLGRHSPDTVGAFERAIEGASRERIVPNSCIVLRGEVKIPVYRRFDFPKSFVNDLLTRYGGLFPNDAHEVDRGVYIFLFRNGSSNLFAITYHACHPVTRHNEKAVSADYVKAIRQGILDRFGTSHSLFFLGCAGDIRPNFANKRVKWLPKSRFNWRFRYPPTEADQHEADQQYHNAIYNANAIASFSVNSSDFFFQLRNLNVKGIGNVLVPEVYIGNHLRFSFFPFEMSHRFHLSEHSREMSPTKFIVSCANHTLGYLPYPDQIPARGYEVDSSRKYMGLTERLMLKRVY